MPVALTFQAGDLRDRLRPDSIITLVEEELLAMVEAGLRTIKSNAPILRATCTDGPCPR
jgi:hypothetical protein